MTYDQEHLREEALPARLHRWRDPEGAKNKVSTTCTSRLKVELYSPFLQLCSILEIHAGHWYLLPGYFRVSISSHFHWQG